MNNRAPKSYMVRTPSYSAPDREVSLKDRVCSTIFVKHYWSHMKRDIERGRPCMRENLIAEDNITKSTLENAGIVRKLERRFRH